MVDTKRSTSVAGDARPAGKAELLAFQRFFQDQYKKVVGMVMLMDGRLDEAEDAASTAFADTFRRWRTITAPKAYVRKAARNAFFKARASDRQFVQILQEAGSSGLLMTENTEDPTFASIGGYQWVDEMIAGLPPTQRQMMRHTVEGLTNKEIAQLLGTNEANVRSNLRHARDRLRQRIDIVVQTTTRSFDQQAPTPRKGETS
ncbi:hypothetical protein amrb99_15120 [Actinomadura sp. RB99]|nr:hypothetical protein [Actinomadura sp. RB99]